MKSELIEFHAGLIIQTENFPLFELESRHMGVNKNIETVKLISPVKGSYRGLHIGRAFD